MAKSFPAIPDFSSGSSHITRLFSPMSRNALQKLFIDEYAFGERFLNAWGRPLSIRDSSSSAMSSSPDSSSASLGSFSSSEVPPRFFASRVLAALLGPSTTFGFPWGSALSRATPEVPEDVDEVVAAAATFPFSSPIPCAVSRIALGGVERDFGCPPAVVAASGPAPLQSGKTGRLLSLPGTVAGPAAGEARLETEGAGASRFEGREFKVAGD